jgi:hypothetical protein
MLPKLVSVTDEPCVPTIEVESKGYIMVRISKRPSVPHVYWQFVDPVYSLLQLGFEWPSGRFDDCSIPLFNGHVEEADVELPAGENGMLYFDVSAWPVRVVEGKGVYGNVIEVPGRIRLVKSANALTIVIKEQPPTRSMFCGDALVCGLDQDNELATITLIGVFAV